jgi:hypothetical protein
MQEGHLFTAVVDCDAIPVRVHRGAHQRVRPGPVRQLPRLPAVGREQRVRCARARSAEGQRGRRAPRRMFRASPQLPRDHHRIHRHRRYDPAVSWLRWIHPPPHGGSGADRRLWLEVVALPPTLGRRGAPSTSCEATQLQPFTWSGVDTISTFAGRRR